MKKRIAVYAGSFDPLTRGHVDLIRKICLFFDKLIIVIAKNPKKSGLFTPEERRVLITQSLKEAGFGNLDTEVVILESNNLLVSYAKKHGATALIRSMRTVTDFEDELAMAYHNKNQEPGIETLFIPPDNEFEKISSSAVREIAGYGGKLDYMVFPCVKKALEEKFKKK